MLSGSFSGIVSSLGELGVGRGGSSKSTVGPRVGIWVGAVCAFFGVFNLNGWGQGPEGFSLGSG